MYFFDVGNVKNGHDGGNEELKELFSKLRMSTVFFRNKHALLVFPPPQKKNKKKRYFGENGTKTDFF